MEFNYLNIWRMFNNLVPTSEKTHLILIQDYLINVVYRNKLPLSILSTDKEICFCDKMQSSLL
jgi:hypothetical protein